METSKPLLSFKLKVAEVVIEYEMKFKHLGLELSGLGDVETKVREQITKATKIVHYALKTWIRIYKRTTYHNIHGRN